MITTYGVFLVNEKNELLITHPTVMSKNSWSIPKGRAEDNELFIETIQRELYEETNLKIDFINDYIVLPISVYKSNRKRLYSILYRVNSGDYKDVELRCDSIVEDLNIPENDIIKWLDFNKCYDLLFDSQVKILKYIKEEKLI
jgi:ADP-ribose pyrophosphatase YjhB (NUDIX family)